jgi:hypothetical protein
MTEQQRRWVHEQEAIGEERRRQARENMTPAQKRKAAEVQRIIDGEYEEAEWLSLDHC